MTPPGESHAQFLAVSVSQAQEYEAVGRLVPGMPGSQRQRGLPWEPRGLCSCLLGQLRPRPRDPVSRAHSRAATAQSRASSELARG